MNKIPQIFLSAGEPSGDHHASHLVREIKTLTEDRYNFEGLGGPEMADQGVKIHFELANYPIMGIFGIFSNLGIIHQAFTRTLTHLRRTRPELLILVDYPGFNLQLAHQAKKLGIKVAYYISPQIWAWWRSRMKSIPKKVDKMLVILPFEEDLYREVKVSAEYVGHPTFDFLNSRDFNREIPQEILQEKEGKRLIGIMPGSRTAEIGHNLPIMLRAGQILSEKISGLSFLIGAPPQEGKTALIRSIVAKHSLKPQILVGKSHYLMAHSHFCLVTSGTATLETSYFKTPMVICYRTDPITSFIGHRIISTRFFGLPNILADRLILPELLMTWDDIDLVVEKALPLIEDTPLRSQALQDLSEVHSLLSQKTGASQNAARAIVKMLE